MTRELRRIEPKSAIRIGFFMGLLCGFLFGLYAAFVVQNLAGILLTPEEAGALTSMQGSVLFSALMTALFGALFCSLMGGLLSWFYNVIAARFGGIEYAVADHAPPDSDNRPTLSDLTSDDERD